MCSVLSIALYFLQSDAQAEITRAWAVDDGTKIRPEDTTHPLAAGNGIYNATPPRVRLFGARNETVAFQLILQGGTQPTSDVNVQLNRIGPLSNTTSSAKATGSHSAISDPDPFYLGQRIILYQQHYVHVRARSASLAWEPKSPAEPPVRTGLIPDPLTPLRPAQQLQIPSHRNIGIWIDIYIPKDMPVGTHHGMLQVRVAGNLCRAPSCNIPVELRVLPFTLPDEPTAKSMLYFSGSQDDRDNMPARYFKAPWNASDEAMRALRQRHYHLGRRHRITLFVGQDRRPDAELECLLDGSMFTRRHGYEGPGEGLGADLYSIHTYGTHEGALTDPSAQFWRRWLDARSRGRLTYFLYAWDEPDSHTFNKVCRIARAARPLPSLVTHRYDPALRDVDIFVARADDYVPRDAATARSAGKRAWIYNGVRPFSGSFLIDDTAISPRVNPWIQFKHGIERWFYWESTYYKDSQGKRGPIDVWREALNFSNADGDRLNGDGLLIYPGRDLIFPRSDQGRAQPMPSIRLKNWRRGIEDVEYLAAARRRGQHKLVTALLNAMIPRSLAETEAGAPVSWTEDGEKWLRARRILADVIVSGRAMPIPVRELAPPPEPRLQRVKRKARALLRRVGRKRLAAAAATSGLAVGGIIVLVLVIRRKSGRTPT